MIVKKTSSKPRPIKRPLLTMKQTIGYATLLASAATLAALLAGTFPIGCAAPAKPNPPIDSTPLDPIEPTPSPDVGDCHASIQSMQSALAIAKISAALLVSKDSKYGPAVKIALAALEGALVNAKSQCDTGDVDAWAVALAAFDAAFSKLVDAGSDYDLAAKRAVYAHEIPPWAVSLEEFNDIAFETELDRPWTIGPYVDEADPE